MQFYQWITNDNQAWKDFGIFCIRVGIGFLIATHGFEKFMGGVTALRGAGSLIGNVGIHFLPLFWGVMGASAEFFGGILIMLGLGTRVAALFTSCVMIVALSYHLNKGDGFRVYEYPLALLIIFIGLMATGSGHYSLDHWLKK